MSQFLIKTGDGDIVHVEADSFSAGEFGLSFFHAKSYTQVAFFKTYQYYTLLSKTEDQA